MTEQDAARRLAPLLARALARAEGPVVEIGADTPSAPRAGSPRHGTRRTGVRQLAAVSAPISPPGAALSAHLTAPGGTP